jgi:hypothetical protein
MSSICSVMNELSEIALQLKEEDRMAKAKPDYLGGWQDGSRFKKKFYETIEDAGRAAVALGIESSADYKRLYKKDKLLPSNPSVTYGYTWAKQGKWVGFLIGT